ncbi:MAG: biotin/lipoyl-containing protein, partial [Evtepia sp.]|nr:biotin/lipoyl-containing protein [Evtepia sp.]
GGAGFNIGQPLGIMVAFTVFTEFLAEPDGEILEICAQNGQVVDYGCPLFRMKGQEGGAL